MKFLAHLQSLVLKLFYRSQVVDDKEEENRSHLRHHADDRECAEAEGRGDIKFGARQRYREPSHKAKRGRYFETLLQDVLFALRQWQRDPGFTIAVVGALALGIGANIAIFTVVNAVLLKPLGYTDADRIVEFGFPSSTVSFLSCIPELRVYQQQTNLFKEVAAYDFSGPGFNLTGDRPEQIRGIHVTEGYFRLFDAPVILGRTFTPQEDVPNGGKVVVLSYGLWQRRFGGDPAIIGKALSLGNESYTIVGVIGKQFFSDPAADVWLPFQLELVSNSMNHFFHVAGLLRPGVTLAKANAELKIAAAQYHRDYPTTNPRDGFQVQPLRDSIVGDVRKSLMIMLAAVSLVLLIACANVANLLLVRATTRRPEFAIRSALGASRSRIVGQLLTESVLLSAAGGVLGLALGFAGMHALLALSPAGLPRIGEGGSTVGVDWRVLTFTVAVSLITGVLFGVFPAFAASRTHLNSSLKAGNSRSGTGFRQTKARSLLVISEVSLALVLLIGSTLLIRTFIALRSVSPGFDSHNVLTMEMSLSGGRFDKTAAVAQLSRNGRDRLNAIPGVEVSAFVYDALPTRVDDGLPFEIVGEPADKDHQYGSRWTSISPGYLSVFKIPVLRGRDFTENDTATTPSVALINQAMAKRFWPKRDPLGQRIVISKGLGATMDESTMTVVGIVGDTHIAGPGLPPDPLVIVPVEQVTDAYTKSYSDVVPLIWVMRTRGDPHEVIATVTEQLRLANGGLPVAHIRTMDEVMGRSTARESFNMALMTTFGAAALILSAIGIYGLMAYSVEQRTREIGIRMALGANRSTIRKLVVWHGMRLALIGIALGIGAALGLTRFLASFLFDVGSWDPAAFFCAPLILFAVALFALWLPASRASKVEPTQALRVE